MKIRNLFFYKSSIELKNNKKFALSTGYAIVAIIAAAVVIAGITPVLTRKLPNLSTSSIIKNPKGWYESFNAPTVGAKYCKKCKEYDDCLAENKENPEICNKPSKTDWNDFPDIITAEDKDPCYGNPACIPYIRPEDIKKIIPFEQYCKSNGKCGPGPRENKGECISKNKPCPCEDGTCEFKPANGVTKYELYAIGGGGSAGSAIAQIPSGETEYKNSVTGKAGRINLPISGLAVISPDERIHADFIDMNKKYTENYANNVTLTDATNFECASNIFYTTGNEPNEHDEAFHTYPTEDYNVKFASVSSKQIMKILKDKNKSENSTYRIGNKLALYKNRYYLYTKYLGAYSYNQNPVLESMPEWLNVDGKEAKYRKGIFEDDIYISLTNEKSHIYRSKGNCGSYIGKAICHEDNGDEYGIKTKDKIQGPILNRYSDVASIACSGDAGRGQDAEYHNTGRMCPWFKDGINCCPKNTVTPISGSRKSSYKTTGECEGESNPNIPVICFREKTLDSISASGQRQYNCKYNVLKKDRVCKYFPRIETYVKCECDDAKQPTVCLDREMYKIDDNKDLDNVCFPYHGKSTVTLDNFSDFPCEEINRNSESRTGTMFEICNKKTGECWTYNGEYDRTVLNCEHLKQRIAERLRECGPDCYGGVASGMCGGKVKLDECTRRGDYILSASGGNAASGICVYVNKKIDQNKLDLTKIINYPTDALTKDVEHNPAIKSGSGAATSFIANPAKTADTAEACIYYDEKMFVDNKCCRVATGASTGQPGVIPNTCEKGGHGTDGTAGKNGEGYGCTSGGGNFPKSSMLDTKTAIKGQKGGYNLDNKTNLVKVSENKVLEGVLKVPGRYNFRYIWYMPFVTKHLMFGLAGEGGEEIHTTLTLSEAQSLVVIPGNGANKTLYTSGKNGKNGDDTRVVNDEANINLIAHGGKGGLGSQKTDEYVLCHKSDMQNQNPELPCYYKDINNNSFKKTHVFDKDGKFFGIQATQPKMSTLVQSIKMSANLKKGTPGMGAMGYGTESVSDFVCEKRHVDKWDEINGKDVMTKADVIASDDSNNELCRGNSKIKYIIPNGSKYSAGTGAVIILW